ncbi:MAG: sarcosine oxidase subunit gamma, partial [Thauera sp.]|nr:sarcosine oxidase subunit gamma [Thauera sp.]
MSEFAIFDAHPTAAFRAESPLSICRITVATQPAAQGAGVVLRECAFLGHLILRGNAADEAFRAGVEVALGVPLPLKVGPVSRDDVRGVSVQWMSPDEWLVVVPQGEDHATEQRLRQALTGHYAVMQV